MEDDDILEIDSPLEQPVDIDEDEIDELLLDGRAAASSSSFSRTMSGKPIHYPAKAEDRKTMMLYPQSLPYECESLEEFDARMDFICQRLVDCVRTRDFDIGLIQWNHRLQCLLSLKYPVQRSTRARLARLYYHLTVLPGMEARIAEVTAKMCMTLLEGKRRTSIADLVLPWRPLYTLLQRELFPKQRKTGMTTISDTLLDLAEYAQRFYDPREATEMLKEMLPMMDGSSINSILATQSLLVHFLPISHPQAWLPTMFRLWESFSSSLLDDLMLDLLARIAEMHVEDPRVSSQQSLEEIGIHSDDKMTTSTNEGDGSASEHGEGLWNEIGIFTEAQFALIMTKCLRSAGLPVGASKAANATLMAQSASHRTGVDLSASAEILSMKKPSDRLHSFATIITYSIAKDSEPLSEFHTPDAEDTISPPGQTHLAGSKALDALARFIQATESYFHPSNWGMWVFPLSTFVKNITWEFVKRSMEEQKPECKTPKAWRLTDDIKKEFCSTLRTVCLLSMFSKDPLTIAASQASLKRMALLEPTIILPPVLDRAYSSLEALETTHRTSSIITALSTLSLPLVSRHIYHEGAKHLVPLLHLCIPGIDLNDSVKTMATSMFILLSCTVIKIDDLTRPELDNGSHSNAMDVDEQQSKMEEEDEAVRLSTAGFEDWTVSFFRRVLALFEALPEEGKGGRTGGKMEEQVTNTVLAACDAVCGSLSDHLFDINFKIVTEFYTSTVSASVVRVIGSLISCFARHNPTKVLAKLFKPCSEAIRAELQGGASSTRTTSTSIPFASDTALHWHLSVLIGAVSYPGKAILPYKNDLLDLMQFVCDYTKTERGYSFAARLVQRLLLCLVSIYPSEQRFVNAEEWDSEEMIKSSHKHWGKVYLAKDVNITWHVPLDEEIGFALEILDRIVAPRLDKLEALQEMNTLRDKIWSNDFCRHLTVARLAYMSVNAMVQEPEDGGGVEAVDAGDEVPEFVQVPERFKSGFLLQDKKDSRYQAVMAFRRRFGKIVQLSAQMTQNSGAEDQIDCVKLLIRSIRSYMTSYSFNPDDYKSHSRSLAFYRSMTHLSARQKTYPRIFWIRRAAYYHTSRARLNSFHRRRSAIDDDLIARILEFTMSNYVAIRRTAQNALDTIAQHYDGTRLLCLPTLLENVAPGTNDDRMKGALYVLGSKSISHLAILDSRFSGRYIIALLKAQHHSKPSIQKLVKGIINDFVIRFAEPCTIRDQMESTFLQEAANFVESKMNLTLTDANLLEAVAGKRKLRIERVNEMYKELVPQLLAIADSPQTHWSFSIYAARLLRALVRKDLPLDERIARHLARQASSENPTMRRVAQNGVTKILYFAKLRTLCLTNEELLLGTPKEHPLKRKEPLPKDITTEWKQERIQAYSISTLNESTKLQDKSALGWLVWGSEETFYKIPPTEGSVFDWKDKDALRGVVEELNEQQWAKMMQHFSQEKDRDYLSAETTSLIKSIFQVYGIEQLHLVKTIIEGYIGERDRHKHRAAAEVISGLYRGSKHWNLKDQQIMWEWLGGLMPRILQECTPDSQWTWQLCVEYMLQQRDPRRATVLVDYIVKTASESLASTQSPWEQAKSQNLLHGILLALGSKFEAWSPPLIEMYFDNFDHDFAEVRKVISDSVADLELLQVAPSFSNVDTLLKACQENKTGSLLASDSESYQRRLNTLTRDLHRYKAERIPKSQGTSKYDLVSMTSLLWISTTMGDHRNTLLSSKVIDFIPTIFESFELHDNTELSAIARAVLTKLSTYQFEQSDVSRLVKMLLGVIESSKESWRSRLDALPVLQVVYFQNLFYLNATIMEDIIESLLKLLQDTHLEVREMASTTLSGLVRCSQRRLIKSLLPRFSATISKHDRLPKRDSPKYSFALLELHSAILGATAILAAFPYDVLPWMPDLICLISRHNDSPVPVSTTVKKMASEFKRTHKDTWQENVHAFNTEQLMEYYEWGGRTDYYA